MVHVVTENDFEKYLCDRHQVQVLWYGDKSAKYKKWYHILMVVTIVLATSAPAIAALARERWMSVLVTALLSLMTGLQQLFRFKELWTTYRATTEALKRELNYYKADVHDYSEKTEEQKRTVFVDRTEAILAQENALWVVAQQSQDGDKTRSGESSTGS